jgi:hypothetical protein
LSVVLNELNLSIIKKNKGALLDARKEVALEESADKFSIYSGKNRDMKELTNPSKIWQSSNI